MQADNTGLAHDTLAPLIRERLRKSDKPGQRAFRILENKVVAYKNEENPIIDEDDLALVEAVADQLAQTAESLRLFEETRQRAGREQVIREITNKLRTAPNLEQLLKIATTELSQRLSAAHAELELGLEGESTPGGNGQNE